MIRAPHTVVRTATHRIVFLPARAGKSPSVRLSPLDRHGRVS